MSRGPRKQPSSILNEPFSILNEPLSILNALFPDLRGPFTPNLTFHSLHQRIAKGAGGKGPRQKTSKIVKKCQKVFRHFWTIFAQGKKTSKIVKKRQNVFRHFSTIFARHLFSGPFWGALTSLLRQYPGNIAWFQKFSKKYEITIYADKRFEQSSWENGGKGASWVQHLGKQASCCMFAIYSIEEVFIDFVYFKRFVWQSCKPQS